MDIIVDAKQKRKPCDCAHCKELNRWKRTIGENPEYRFSWKRLVQGSNIILFLVYTFLGLVYIGLATLQTGYIGDIANKHPGQFSDLGTGQDTQGLEQFGSFGRVMAITSYIAGVILIAAWMWMCARRRHVFIGAFKLHPKTNIVVESLFVASHICIVISDRTFVNILPAVSAITFAEFVYPLSMAVVVILGLIFLYLLCKLFVAFGSSDEVQA